MPSSSYSSIILALRGGLENEISSSLSGVIIIILISIFLRYYFSPYSHQVFDDGYVYKHVAENLFIRNSFTICYDINCENLSIPVWAPVWPFIISFVYSIPHIFSRTGKFTENQITYSIIFIEFVFACLIWVI